MTYEEILEDFPDLTMEDILAYLRYGSKARKTNFNSLVLSQLFLEKASD